MEGMHAELKRLRSVAHARHLHCTFPPPSRTPDDVYSRTFVELFMSRVINVLDDSQVD